MPPTEPMTDPLEAIQRTRDAHHHIMDMLTPAEIDAQLSLIWEEDDRTKLNIARTTAIRDKEQERKERRQSRGGWYSWDEAHLTHLDAHLVTLRSKHLTLLAEAEPYEDEFRRRGGWARYFKVTNGNGHIHRGTNCATCYPTTQFAWLVHLAGQDEAAMVAQYGADACTVCFPTAPVEEMRRARDAAKAAEYCAGSGRAAQGNGRQRYRTCPVCGKYIQLNESSWTLRKHKPPKAGR